MGWTQAAWIGFGALIFFWVVGASSRLGALRQAAVAAFGPAAAALASRHRLVLELATAAASPAVPRSAPGDSAMRPRAAEVVLQACAQATTTLEQASARPLARGRIGGVSIAERMLEHAWSTLRASLACDARPAAESLVSLGEVELELAVRRQAFNLAVEAYNRAIRQVPARWLALVLGFRPLDTLAAGADLVVAAPSAASPRLPSAGSAAAPTAS